MKKKIIYVALSLIIIAILLIALNDSVATDDNMITISKIIEDFDNQRSKINSSVVVDATDEDFDKIRAIINKYSNYLDEIEMNYTKKSDDEERDKNKDNYVLIYPNNVNGDVTCKISFKDGEASQLDKLACYTNSSQNYFHIQDYIRSFLEEEDKNNSTYNIIMSYLNMKIMAELYCNQTDDGDFVQNKGTVKNYSAKPTVSYRGSATVVTDRVHSLLFMYKITNDNKYAERLKAEILYICDWENEWISSQYLDTAEIVYDVGMAYDYLYDKLSEVERRKIETRLIESLFLYSNINLSLSHFADRSSNWNSVCNSGTGVGAISLMRNSNYRIYVEDGKSEQGYTALNFLGIDYNGDSGIDYSNSNTFIEDCNPDDYEDSKACKKYNSFPYTMTSINLSLGLKNVYQLLKEEDGNRDSNNKILKRDTDDKLYIELKDLCALIIKSTLLSLPLSLTDNSLDGGDPEGIAYYQFAMRFYNYYTSTLYNAFNTVYNLLDISTEKMNNYLLSPIYISDNKGEAFSYSDANSFNGTPGAGIKDTTWLNNYYARNKTIDGNESIIRDSVRLMYDWRRRLVPVWNFSGVVSYDSEFDIPVNDYSFYDYVFDNTVYKTVRDNLNTNQDNISEVLSFRNTFDLADENGFMVAIKTGDSAGGHQHLDLASYDYGMFNYKFIREIGSASYTTNYFSYDYHRWKYYKTRAEAHSTIVINPDMLRHKDIMADQWRFAHPIYDQFYTDNVTSLAIFDLTDIYNKNDNNCQPCENNINDNKVRRGFQFVNSKNVMVVQDEVSLEENGDFYSFLNINSNYGNDHSGTKVLLYLFDDEENFKDCINIVDGNINYENLIKDKDTCTNKEQGRIAILQLKEDKTKIVKVVLNSNQDNHTNNLFFEKVKREPLNQYLISPDAGDKSIDFSQNSPNTVSYKLQIHATNAKDIVSKVTYIPVINSNDIYVTDRNILLLKNWQNGEENIVLSSEIDAITLNAKSASYTGNAISANTATSLSGTTITYKYYNNTNCSGTELSSAPVNVGNYSVKATSAGNENYLSGSICVPHTITRANAILNLDEESIVLKNNNGQVGYSYDGDGEITCTSDNDGVTCSVDTINKKINVSLGRLQSATLEVRASSGTNYNETSALLNVSKEEKTNAIITCNNKTYNGLSQVIATCFGGTINNATQTNAGSYTITCTGDNNHDNAESISCSISKIDDIVTITKKNVTYSENNESVNVSSLSNTDVNITYYSNSICTQKTVIGNAVVEGGAPRNVGTYYVIATSVGNNNYNSGTTGCIEALVISNKNITENIYLKSNDNMKINANSLIVNIAYNYVLTYKDVMDNLIIQSETIVVRNSNNSVVSNETAALGTGSKIELSTKSYTIVVNGDINGDGKISSLDYVAIRNHILKTNMIDNNSVIFLASDMNSDNKISALDYIAIRNMIINQ